MRGTALVGLVVAGLLVACGDSSPTEPDPVVPGSLAGTWRGEMSGSLGGGAFTCGLEAVLSEEDDGFFVGSWSAECPGGRVAGALVAAAILDFSVFTALGSTADVVAHPLGVCGWAAPLDLAGDELSGTWTAPENCEEPGLAGGVITLRFVG